MKLRSGKVPFIVLVSLLIRYPVAGQGPSYEPKPAKRISFYQSPVSGDSSRKPVLSASDKTGCITDLRGADADFELGHYDAAATVYIKYADWLDAEQNDRLGWMYYKGNGVTKNFQTAFQYFEIAANAEHPQATYYLALMHDRGYGVDYDRLMAAKLYDIAAGLGNSDAMNQIGLGYLRKNSSKMAMNWFRKAAALGNGDGMVNIGNLFENGLGVKKNPDSSLKWFRESADAGNNVGMFNLGLSYHLGLDRLTKDYDSALKWYRLSADLGYADAMTNLGSMYEYGQGAPEDYALAMQWYQKGAAAGDYFAMIDIGNLYKNGKGVEPDLQKANTWYDSANRTKQVASNPGLRK
jgi:uncharacterized protein